ncbi:hypothetical protein DFP72DRAFT_1066917 [Ephemerocybe angulata]|uniref:Uncharacterized protein n=1 Tax=Ephemerocybe angulata TaxID=980116 RepID=A0A8H6HZU2_9AGAR|nr:hypothetical protein DFP72DRAFT_1066917 [Tulosesus angulatus]
MEPSQEATTSSKPPASPQSKIPRRTSSRTQQHPSRKSSTSASASTSLSLNAPAPWLMRRTSHGSLRGGKSASTTSLSVPGSGGGGGAGGGGGGSGGGGMGGTSPAAAPVASVTVVFAGGTGAPPCLSAEESVGMLAGLTASPSSSSVPSPVSVPPPNSASSTGNAFTLCTVTPDDLRPKRPSFNVTLDFPVQACKLVRIPRPLQDKRIVCLEYYLPWDFPACTRTNGLPEGKRRERRMGCRR